MNNIPQKLHDLPLWQGKISVSPLTGGRSNEAYIVCDDGAQGAKYVVRFCRDLAVHHVFRDHEAMVSNASAKARFSPGFIHFDQIKDEYVMVFEFITAKTYDKPDVIANLKNVVARLRDFHNVMPQNVSGRAQLFNVFHVISDYTATLKQGNSSHFSKLAKYKSIAGQLKSVQMAEPIIFGHNDLIPDNILDDGQTIWFIDFEYAAFSTPLSDLANLATNASLTPQQDKQLLALYFGTTPGDDQIKAMMALKCALMLRETMWSMVSEIHLDAPGVNYAQYTSECLSALANEFSVYQTKYGKFMP